MTRLKGTIQPGVGNFRVMMTTYADAFRKATGEQLYPGTLNVKVPVRRTVKEHFRIKGIEVGTPHQDLIFEICRLDGTWAYRIRPYVLQNGKGGWGDDVLEIASTECFKDSGLKDGDAVNLEFFD